MFSPESSCRVAVVCFDVTTLNPFRAAVPFGGQIYSNNKLFVSRNVDCGSKRIKNALRLLRRSVKRHGVRKGVAKLRRASKRLRGRQEMSETLRSDNFCVTHPTGFLPGARLGASRTVCRVLYLYIAMTVTLVASTGFAVRRPALPYCWRARLSGFAVRSREKHLRLTECGREPQTGECYIGDLGRRGIASPTRAKPVESCRRNTVVFRASCHEDRFRTEMVPASCLFRITMVQCCVLQGVYSGGTRVPIRV